MGTGNILDIQNGTLTTSASQNKSIIEGTNSDIDIGNHKFSAAQLDISGTVEFAGNVIFSQDGLVEFHNQTIDGVTINNTTIGDENPSTGKFTTIDAEIITISNKLKFSSPVDSPNIIESHNDIIFKGDSGNSNLKIAIGGIESIDELLEVRSGSWPITNEGARFGELKVGTRGVSLGEGDAGLAHHKYFNDTEYAFMQTQHGNTKINAVDGKDITFLIDGTTEIATASKGTGAGGNTFTVNGTVNATNFIGDASGLGNILVTSVGQGDTVIKVDDSVNTIDTVRMTFKVDNENCLTLNKNKNIGILNDYPSETLDVNGSINFTENLKYNNVPIAVDTCCLLYTSPSPRDAHESRMPSSA